MSTYSIYRRPLSRNFTRYEPWVSYPFDQNWTSFPPQVNTNISESHNNNQNQNSYGSCECIDGQFISGKSQCNITEGYVGVCDGPYGTRCICTNLQGDAGCASKKLGKGVWCPG